MTTETAAPTATPQIDAIVAKYIELRDAKEEKSKKLKEELVPIETAMKGIETYLMALAVQSGQTQFGTAHGTAFVTTESVCNVADWNATLEYIRANNAYNLLNKAVNKTAVGEVVDATGTPPPGVNWTVMKKIQIRRKS